MKKQILTFLTLTLFAFSANSQDPNVAGYVTYEDGSPAIDETVYIFNPETDADPNDTITSAVVNSSGWYQTYVDPNVLFDLWGLSSSACPDEVIYMNNDFVDSLFVDIICGDSVVPPVNYLHIGGNPVDESGYSWLFISSAAGEVVSYDWTIDGQTFTTEDVEYTFPNPGTYLVELTVQMAGGIAYDASMEVTISETVECSANFFPTADSLSGSDGVVFVNASTGDDLEYFWDFGDGNFSFEPYPLNVYDEFMDYTVCLTVFNNFCADTLCITLTEELLNSFEGSGIMVNPDNEGNPLKDVVNTAKTDGFTFEVVPFPTGTLSNGEELTKLESQLYPNPSTGQVFMKLSSERNEAGTIRLHDMTGKVVYQRSANLSSGENNFTFNLDHLAKGMYVFVFSSENSTAMQKLSISE